MPALCQSSHPKAMLHGVASLIIMLRAPLQSFFWSFPFLSVSSSVVLESESKVAQSCPTLCNPMDCSLPGSIVHWIFQAKILEWVTIAFSRRSSRPRDWTRVSRIVGRRFTVWANREVLNDYLKSLLLSWMSFTQCLTLWLLLLTS